MQIENIIEKLKCATRCHPNAVEVLISEAIEMLGKHGDEFYQLGYSIIGYKEDVKLRDERIAKLENWHKAVLHECMMTESCYVESDPLQSVKNLIAWHVANEREQMKQEPVGYAHPLDIEKIITHSYSQVSLRNCQDDSHSVGLYLHPQYQNTLKQIPGVWYPSTIPPEGEESCWTKPVIVETNMQNLHSISYKEPFNDELELVAIRSRVLAAGV